MPLSPALSVGLGILLACSDVAVHLVRLHRKGDQSGDEHQQHEDKKRITHGSRHDAPTIVVGS